MAEVAIIPITDREWKPRACQKPGCKLRPAFWRQVTSRRTNRWGYVKPVVRRTAYCTGHAGRVGT